MLYGEAGWATDPIDESAVVPGSGQQSDGPILPIPGDNDTTQNDESLDITGATLSAQESSSCGTDPVAGVCITATISGPFLGSLPPPDTGANGTLTTNGSQSTITIYVPGSEVQPTSGPALQAGSLLDDPTAFDQLDVGSNEVTYLGETTDSADDTVPPAQLDSSSDCKSPNGQTEDGEQGLLCSVNESVGEAVKVQNGSTDSSGGSSSSTSGSGSLLSGSLGSVIGSLPDTSNTIASTTSVSKTGGSSTP